MIVYSKRRSIMHTEVRHIGQPLSMDATMFAQLKQKRECATQHAVESDRLRVCQTCLFSCVRYPNLFSHNLRTASPDLDFVAGFQNI